MTPGLKQRLIGAAVLIALAVIFLPMLVKGPAPESGLPDLPLQVPDAPGGPYRTVDLPLVAPEPAPAAGVLGRGAALAEPAVASAQPAADGAALPTVEAGATAEPLPATTAGGGYAVHYAAFASESDAAAILRQLGESGLGGYQEGFSLNGQPARRVRLGPYASRAEAEIVRIRAAQVRDDVNPRVVALDAGAAPVRTTAASPPAATPTPTPAPAATPPAATQPAAAETPRTTGPTPASTTAASPPAPAAEPAARPASPTATADIGFVVQVGAFASEADANALRDRLRGAGITAFTDSVQTDKGRLTRVKAGPVAGRDEATQLKTRVRSAIGVDGLIRAHP